MSSFSDWCLPIVPPSIIPGDSELPQWFLIRNIDISGPEYLGVEQSVYVHHVKGRILARLTLEQPEILCTHW